MKFTRFLSFPFAGWDFVVIVVVVVCRAAVYLAGLRLIVRKKENRTFKTPHVFIMLVGIQK